MDWKKAVDADDLANAREHMVLPIRYCPKTFRSGGTALSAARVVVCAKSGPQVRPTQWWSDFLGERVERTVERLGAVHSYTRAGAGVLHVLNSNIGDWI